MLKVAIDTSVLQGPSAFRGIGKYTSQLLPALRSNRKLRVLEIKRGFDFNSVDLIHYPYFDFFFLTLSFFKKKKTVVTIHDCTPLIFPQAYPSGFKGKIKFFLQKQSLKGVAAVITDSENSKKDIVKFLRVPKEKIEVIYLAADENFKKLPRGGCWQSLVKKKYHLPDSFILYVGDVNYNKNLPGLLRAFASLSQKESYLILVGKAFKNRRLKEIKELTALIKELDIVKRVLFLGFVPDKDLVRLYNLASVCCQASFYEGFGIQILEAMASGCPVVTGNVSSMPEVAGEAAILVDPYSQEDIVKGIEKVLGDKSLRERLIEKGFRRVKEFSWEKTAAKTIEVYRKVLS